MIDPRTGVDIDKPLEIESRREDPPSLAVILACAAAMVAIWIAFHLAIGGLPA
jgi:hypothetical protein